MRPVRLHPRVYDDIDEALASTRARFRCSSALLQHVPHEQLELKRRKYQ